MQRSMKKEAKRVAKIIKVEYERAKQSMFNASEVEVVRSIFFNEEKFAKLSEEFKKRVNICCKTINGLCYMMVLDVGVLKGAINLRSLQFTTFMDRELEAIGFPVQSHEQKREILEVMDLAIKDWENICDAVM